MITPSDKEFAATKLIMQGKEVMKNEFKPLADWIDKNFGVKVINIIYDTIQNARPRLQVIFEFQKEAITFNNDGGKTFGYDPQKQAAIADQFGVIMKGQNTENVWVTYSAFEPIAKMEANAGISENEIENLKKRIACVNLWEISRCFSSTTFFLYTDNQVAEALKKGLEKEWSHSYFHLLKQHDEFHYFRSESFSIALDSKENFDKNFQGNWHYYYK